MKSLLLSAALLLSVTAPAFAYDADTAAATPQADSAKMKHCRSMMRDGKMMEGMPKQMTDECAAMMKNDGMAGTNKPATPSGPASPQPRRL